MAARGRREEKELERISIILTRLEDEYPDAHCALHHRDAFQLLVATILSAQCTDVRVNKVTPKLFATYPDPRALAAARQEELEDIIRSTGFFRNKARSLIGSAQVIVGDFQGDVPHTMDELLRLPGVARKTANVVLGTAFGIPDGVVVDTHVGRISRRLGLSFQKNADKVEQDLMGRIPQQQWIDFSHRLIHHGRRTCKAQRPRCPQCCLTDVCPFYQEEVRSA
jgi:endonuclease-3